ncbi:methylenetetrahydrofolate reductase [Candidatus Blochmanniella camponoti]|uniref:Methylenetetrahydrofolate reductase n=1 Tax=Candidatus Blochmanniella camponoti TaxID=108080 RepID=A0ABY4SWN9_9ENTR|nr:methylenetetrahydrofolate reductase [Candidatus Blochmannia herculeanus]URJ24417.1 methylenetetrahydrofolate reductase [Candidatus Blochmannia herculeanus]URJ26974.1 methylenetetrahydrofolate reductase [Candidatus Blochmannia herculeanus]
MSMFHATQQAVLNQYLAELQGKINVSFEFFPPRTDEMEQILWKTINKLSKLNPIFVSVTYSAHSGTRNHTDKTIKDIKKRTGLIAAPHLTCINETPQALQTIAQEYWNNGIHNIVALRGDQIKKTYQSSMYASDLVYLLKKIGNFDIAVAAYPEVHPEAKSAQSDLINLKKKIDAGANRAITQFFFDVEQYLRFRDLCVSVGIDIEIIPGILPIFNFRQLQHFITFTKVKIPHWIYVIFHGLDHDLETQKMLGTFVAIDMIRVLLKEGVRNFHFYTLNRSDLTYAICHTLGIKNNKM